MPVNTESVKYDALIIGDYPIAVRAVTIASGAGELKRGTVIGKVTSSGEYVTSLSAAGDGSETPRLILAADVDATSAAVATQAYASGEFNANEMTFGAGVTAATFEAACDDADRALFIKTPV